MIEDILRNRIQEDFHVLTVDQKNQWRNAIENNKTIRKETDRLAGLLSVISPGQSSHYQKWLNIFIDQPNYDFALLCAHPLLRKTSIAHYIRSHRSMTLSTEENTLENLRLAFFKDIRNAPQADQNILREIERCVSQPEDTINSWPVRDDLQRSTSLFSLCPERWLAQILYHLQEGEYRYDLTRFPHLSEALKDNGENLDVSVCYKEGVRVGLDMAQMTVVDKLAHTYQNNPLAPIQRIIMGLRKGIQDSLSQLYENLLPERSVETDLHVSPLSVSGIRAQREEDLINRPEPSHSNYSAKK